MRITNYEFQISVTAEFIRSGGNGSAFQAEDFSGVFVRRSETYGYEGYCLSGKGERSGEMRSCNSAPICVFSICEYLHR